MDQTWTPIVIDGILREAHPEQKPGEVWLKDCNGAEPDEFEEIEYQTKRAGQTAYDKNGNVVPYHFPVFVWEVEHNSRQREVKIGQ